MFVQLKRAAVALTVAGIIFAQAASAGVNDGAYARPQHLVDIGGGRHLNIYCIGTGSPTVVLELGLGVMSIYNWRKVQPVLAQRTRVCAYERAGYGFSDPGPLPRDAAAVASDLHALLQKGHIPAPYVLVGHSSGGFFARMYADRYRPEVAGLVLIDPDEEDTAGFDAIYGKALGDAQTAQFEKMLEACADKARLHKLTIHDMCAGKRDPSVSEAIHEANEKHVFAPGFWDAWLSEMKSANADSREIIAEQRDYGRLPFIVLMAADSEEDNLNYGATKAQVARAIALEKKVHAADAAHSEIGVSCVVPNTGHFIQLEKPNAVIDAVLDAVREARAGTQAKPSPCHYT